MPLPFRRIFGNTDISRNSLVQGSEILSSGVQTLDDRSLFRRDFYFRAGRQISIGQAGQSLIEPIDSLRSGASGATIIHRGSLGRAINLFRSPVSSSIIFRAFHLPPSVCAHKPNQFHDFSGIKDLSYVFDDVDFKN